MKKMKIVGFLVVLMFVAGIALVGCSGGGEEQAAEPAATEEAAPAEAAGGEEAAAPAEKAAGEEAAAEEKAASGASLEKLCNKLVDEMKTMGTPESALDQSRSGCMQGAQAYEGNSKALDLYVDYIMKACEGKSGQEWFSCYSAEAQAAAQKAAEAMQ